MKWTYGIDVIFDKIGYTKESQRGDINSIFDILFWKSTIDLSWDASLFALSWNNKI